MQATASQAGPRRFDRSRPVVGVVLTWPHLKNAEYEVVRRFMQAGRNVGADVRVVDNDGYLLWSSDGVLVDEGRRLGRDDLDFIVSLHFESPRLYDVYSYITLWNPTDFYFLFGYDGTSARLLSHNDCLSCRSDQADEHALNLFRAVGREPDEPFPVFFSSVGGPFFAPRVTSDSRLFYIGINWERVSGAKGRHHDLLERLDSEDLIRIYGPETFAGVKPWEGFRNYAGSVPFDGSSVVAEINRAGICLAISSEAHKTSGIMSNRLFEGLAAGAVVIADRHPFVERYFEDCVYIVDDLDGPEALAQQVRSLVLAIRADPEAAMERARIAQERFRDFYSMDARFTALLDAHAERVASFERRMLGEVNVVQVLVSCVDLSEQAWRRLALNVTRQLHVKIDVVLIVDRAQSEAAFGEMERAFRSDAVRRINVYAEEFYQFSSAFEIKPRRRRAIGQHIHAALLAGDCEFFCFLRPGEEWFSDHVASLACSLAKSEGCFMARSGALIESNGPDGKRPRRLESLGIGNTDDFLFANNSLGGGRSLFRRSLLEKIRLSALLLLDGQEAVFFAAHAFLLSPVAASQYATLVIREDERPYGAPLFVPLEHQQQFIRDSLAGSIDRQVVLAGAAGPSRLVWASAGGAPIRWENFRQTTDASEGLEIDTYYATKRGGNGAAFLGRGFSIPEGDYTWLEGKFGEIAFSLPRCEGDLDLILELEGRAEAVTGRRQHCTVTINGLPVAYLPVGSDKRFAVRLNPAVYKDAASVRVGLHVDHADFVPSTSGAAEDPRRLALNISGFGVFQADPDDLPVMIGGGSAAAPLKAIRLDRVYHTGAGQEGLPYLTGGFSTPEERFTWIDGDRAQATLPLRDASGPAELVLDVEGRAKAETGRAQRCVLVVDGATRGTFTVTERANVKVVVDLGERAGVSTITIDLLLDHADPVYDEAGKIVDERSLSLKLFGFGLFSI